RLPHHVVSRGWKRRPRRSAQDVSALGALEQEREVRPSALADPPCADFLSRAQAVQIEELAHALEHEQRRQRKYGCLRGGLDEGARGGRERLVLASGDREEAAGKLFVWSAERLDDLVRPAQREKVRERPVCRLRREAEHPVAKRGEHYRHRLWGR